jgi:hypothetical protein
VAQQDAPDTPDRDRYAVLKSVIETAMVILGFAWIALLIIEFTSGLSPELSAAFNVIRDISGGDLASSARLVTL